MLKSVFIHNYNCFVEFKLDLPQKALLVGSNGSGKSSFCEALAWLQDVVTRSAEVATAFPTRSLTGWLGQAPLQRLAIDWELDQTIYHYELDIIHDLDKRTPSIQRERLELAEKVLYELNEGEVRLFGDDPQETPRTRFPASRKRSFLPDLEPRPDNKRILAFRDALASVQIFKPSPQGLEPTSANEAFWLERDGKNFASWFRHVLVERSGLGGELLKALQPTMPGLDQLGVVYQSPQVRELMLTFRAAGRAYKLSAGELSDGQRTLLMLYGFLLGAADRAGLVCLDEPEIGLAPHEMQPWLSALLATIDEHKGQALVISHHPAVIDYLAPFATIRFSRPAGGPAQADEVTLETTGGTKVSEWLTRPWAYENEHEEPAA